MIESIDVIATPALSATHGGGKRSWDRYGIETHRHDKRLKASVRGLLRKKTSSS